MDALRASIGTEAAEKKPPAPSAKERVGARAGGRTTAKGTASAGGRTAAKSTTSVAAHSAAKSAAPKSAAAAAKGAKRKTGR
jgi:hypothetical protein